MVNLNTHISLKFGVLKKEKVKDYRVLHYAYTVIVLLISVFFLKSEKVYFLFLTAGFRNVAYVVFLMIKFLLKT